MQDIVPSVPENKSIEMKSRSHRKKHNLNICGEQIKKSKKVIFSRENGAAVYTWLLQHLGPGLFLVFPISNIK